jgi:Tol biopolymer transport system component
MAPSRQQRRAADRNAKGRTRRPVPIGFYASIGAGLIVLLGWVTWVSVRDRAPVREGSPSWSPDGRQIVYYAEHQGKGDLYVMDADGTHVRRLTDTPADEGGPAFSPSGREIAYDTDRDGNFEIYAMYADGTHIRRLTHNPARDVSPAWSPDGRKIAFMSDRASRPNFDIYLMNPDGSDVQRLTQSGSNWFPQFSPDGTKLAFHVWRDVHVLDLKTHTDRRLTTDPNNGMYPTWSPDGARLAFMTWRDGPTEIFTMHADGAEQNPLVRFPTGSAIDPRWSPDGEHIVFERVPETSPTQRQNADQERAIYVVDVLTGKVTRLSR